MDEYRGVKIQSQSTTVNESGKPVTRKRYKVDFRLDGAKVNQIHWGDSEDDVKKAIDEALGPEGKPIARLAPRA